MQCFISGTGQLCVKGYFRSSKICDRGTSHRYLLRTENSLFYFALESEKKVILSGLQTLIFPFFIIFFEKRSYCRDCKCLYFPFFIIFFFTISIPNVKLIPQLINVIATNNDLLMDELKVIYFAPKLWLYAMIWKP